MRPLALSLFALAAALLTSAPSTTLAAPATSEDRRSSVETTNESVAPRSPRPPLLALGIGLRRAFLPHSISHDAIGANIELRPVSAVSLGVAAALFSPFDQSYRARPAAWPLSRTLGVALVEVKGFVLGGHAQGKELYVLGGVGMIGTRPVSLVDPVHRRFDYEARFAFACGAGGRIHIAQWLAAFAEARVTSYLTQYESARLASTAGFSDEDRYTWFGDRSLVSMFESQFGLIAFLSP